MGICLVLVFLKTRGGLFFNNLEEVNHTMEVDLVVWLGLDCMYRLLPLGLRWQWVATQALK
jgi:hypothetical protein